MQLSETWPIDRKESPRNYGVGFARVVGPEVDHRVRAVVIKLLQIDKELRVENIQQTRFLFPGEGGSI